MDTSYGANTTFTQSPIDDDINIVEGVLTLFTDESEIKRSFNRGLLEELN